MQKVFEKQNCTIVLLAFELLGNNVFFMAVGRRTPHTAFKSLLKYMYSGQGINSELFSLLLKALVSVEEVARASLRSGGEDNYPHMLLVIS